MDASTLLNAHVQLKKMYTHLNETLDLSRQLAEAVDRDDQVAVQMLVSMRQEPVEKLRLVRQALEQQVDSLEYTEARRLAGLLNGQAAENEAESPLAAQVGINNRVLRQVQELDKAISLKLARDKSIYH